MIKKYFKIWKILAIMFSSAYMTNRIESATFFLGKITRFVFFVLFIISIFNNADNLAGYNKNQVIFLFLTFNIVDVGAQFLFRGIYLFRDKIRNGNFDYVLCRPLSALFFSLSRMIDILDLLFLIPIVVYMFILIPKLGVAFSIINPILYLILLALGFLLVLCIHVLSACITLWTMESESIIWLYRESMTIGRFPPEIFNPFLQFAFTYFLPIIMIIAFPAKAMFGMLSIKYILVALVYAAFFFCFTIYFWNISLKKYTSASS